MQKQRGITLIGMLVTVALVVCSIIIVMRVVPVYIQYYSIVQSVKSLNKVPASSLTGDPATDTVFLKSTLDKYFVMNSVEVLNAQNVSITPNGEHHYKVLFKYQEVRSLLANVSLLFDFNELYEVTPGSEN